MTVLAALIFLGAHVVGQSAEPGRVTLRGHIPAAVARLTPKGFLPATNQLHLAIGLPLRNQSALDELLRQLYDPASPNFHQFITPQEFAARFGPTEADYAAVKKFAETNGFAITGTHPNRVVLDVVGGVTDVERTFGVRLRTYRHPTEPRDFYAPDTEPSFNTGLPILHVGGLDNFSLPHPNSRTQPVSQQSGAIPNAGSGPGSTYMGGDFRAAYVPGVALTGSGQNVALLQFDGYVSNDIAAYISQANLTGYAISLTNVPVNGGVAVPGGGDGEVSLDIEMVIAMAPGVSKIIVYEAPNGSTAWSTILSRIANDNLARQISCSWGGGSVDPTVNGIFQQMAAQGQSFFCASGDADAYTTSVPFLLDNTNITLVGGTVLTTGSGSSYGSETVWNDRTVNPNGGNWGSSGGVSPTYTIPVWQQGVSMASNLGSTNMRNLPDVALTGKNVFIVAQTNQQLVASGTSCAAPLWAGFMALVNEQAATATRPAAGFINPAVYAIGTGTNYSNCFNDITTGDNTWSGSPSKYPAVAGYDLCTGWGTPAGQNLMNALAGQPEPLGILPDTGLVSASGTAGGPFSGSTQIVTLTNFSAAPLDWSIINTSAWLNVSASSGTLAVAGQTTVNVSLNSAANGLSAGTYPATIIFSNQTSGIFQSRQFNLQVFDPLLLLTTAGFSAIGPAGGRFYPGTQNVVFTNQGSSPQNWSLINTSTWLSVSSVSGSIPGNGLVTVTVSTNAATAALGNGIYNTTLLLSNQTSHLTQSLVDSALVGQSLVQNGGFETGNLTSWALSGSSSLFAVSSTSTYVHSGAYGLNAKANSLGYITQNLPTAPGQTYQLSFWFFITSSHSGQLFQANWNGATIYSSSSPPTSWNNQKFIVTATSTNTQIQFGLNSASSNSRSFALDDISVTPVNLPAISQQPVSQTNLIGSNIVFTAAATGTAPLAYQWFTNGVGLVNGGNLSGATSNVLSVSAITSTNAGNYTLVVTNLYGSVTSSVAVLAVLLPAAITVPPAAQNIQCGSNASFSVTATGTAPLKYQWSLNNAPITGATNASLLLTNVHLPGYTVSAVVTNLYGGATNSASLTVQDTLPPVITLNGASRMTNELGSAFTDPGAVANDLCMGAVLITTNGNVNIAVVGTNILTYFASDGNGNSSTNTRTVVVRDTTPPTILWGFTNLVLAANSNCVATLPNVTETNYILATDLSGALTITQSPTNSFLLPLGTNLVVITVTDGSGNAARSTNQIVVQDQTPPNIVSQPQSQTNLIGANVAFTAAATACTTLGFQWYFNNALLSAQTNNTLTLSNIGLAAAGNYFVVATATGGSSTSTVAALTVDLIPTTLALTSSENPSGFNDALNFTASVTPSNAAGTVQFFTNGAVFDLEALVAGIAVSTNLNSLPRGTNFVTAVYSGDANDLPSTNSFDQLVTNHPPVVAPAFYALAAGLNLNILVADLATNWSDADDDLLSLVGVNPSTNGVVVINGGNFLFYTNANYVNDQFACIISDGFGGTNFQTITITIVPQTNSTPAIAAVTSAPASGLTLKLEGGYGSTYVLESTTDFLSGVWIPVATNTLDITGIWQFTDSGAASIPSRFYRLKRVQ